MSAFRIEADASAETMAQVQAGLGAFNRAATGVLADPRQINLAAWDGDKLIGGIIGRVFIDAAYLDIVWVDEVARGQGLGRALMAKAEEDGLRAGANYVWLNTLSWQARPFYEKLGYRVFGELPVMDNKHRRYFMCKDLT